MKDLKSPFSAGRSGTTKQIHLKISHKAEAYFDNINDHYLFFLQKKQWIQD